MGMLFFATSFARVLCTILVGFAFVSDAVAYVTAFFAGAPLILSRNRWRIAFGLLWLVWFPLAWHVAVAPFLGDRIGPV